MMPGMEMTLLDIDVDDACGAGREEVGYGQPGEILLRGPNIFAGYWGRKSKETMREAFTHDGWYRTGDVGIMDSIAERTCQYGSSDN